MLTKPGEWLSLARFVNWRSGTGPGMGMIGLCVMTHAWPAVWWHAGNSVFDQLTSSVGPGMGPSHFEIL